MRVILRFVTIIMLCSSQLMALNGESIGRSSNDKTFDSIDECIDLAIKNGDKVKAVKLLNKKGKLLFDKGLYTNEFIVLDNALKLSDNGRDTLKHTEMKEQYMETLNCMGVAYSYVARYDDAIGCYIKMDKYNKNRYALYKVKFLNGMGVAFSMNGKYDYAMDYYRQAIPAINRLVDEKERKIQLFPVYSNIGGAFLMKKNYDSAEMYIVEAQRIAVLMKDKNREIICLQLLAAMNSGIGKNELAINYYNDAHHLALDANYDYMIPFIKMNITDCYISAANYKAAFQSANEGLELARRRGAKKVEMGILLRISRIYEELKNSDMSLKYLKESNDIRDSIFSQDNENRFLRQKSDFDIYKMSVERELIDKNLEIQKSRVIINNLVISIIILLLIALAIILTYRLVRQNNRNAMLAQQRDIDVNNLICEKQQLEAEVERQSHELALNELLMVKRSEQSSLTMSKLKALKTNFPARAKGTDTIKEIEDLVVQMSNDNFGSGISYYLDQITADFYDKLDIICPELTSGEKKICALMSFGLSLKDIVSMTGKSRGAIDNFKFRIKKKIIVDSETDLGDYFFHLRS